jgi:hypothetical protein
VSEYKHEGLLDLVEVGRGEEFVEGEVFHELIVFMHCPHINIPEDKDTLEAHHYL